MTTHCFKPILGKRMRVTILDTCGRIPAGVLGKFVCTDGFITVKMSSQVEDGAEIVQKNASGALCINERMNSNFKRLDVEISFCGVNPSLLAIVSNASTYADWAGDIAGITIAEGEFSKAFGLELWTGLAGQACAAGADVASGYMLLPFVAAGVIGDVEVTGENAVNFSLTGAYTKGGNTWGVGPYRVVKNVAGVASFLPTALDDLDHFLLMDSGLALPPVACDPQPMPVNGTTTTTTTAATTTTTTTA